MVIRPGSLRKPAITLPHVRTVVISSTLGGLVGGLVSLGLYLSRNTFSQRIVTTTDFPRRYVDYLPVRSGSAAGYSWWPVTGASVGFGVVAGLLLGVLAASIGFRVTRRGVR
jgi:hypothetical protein